MPDTRAATTSPREVALAALNRLAPAAARAAWQTCCASERGQMLAALHERLENAPGHELEIAAAEQREITRLRLATLLAS